MQVLVMYYSRTGTTEKLALQIAEGVREVEGVRCLVKKVDQIEAEDFLASDAIIAGSPVYYGQMASEMKKVFDSFNDIRPQMGNKLGAAFATSADPTGGKETTMLSILQAMLIFGMIIVGDPLEATGHYGVACSGAPDTVIAKNARLHGKRVANLVKKLRA